jgi:hypothetical protein
LHGFRNHVSVSEVILVALPKRLGISRRHLFDLVTKPKQIPGHVVRGHARFDPDEAWRYVPMTCNSVPGNSRRTIAPFSFGPIICSVFLPVSIPIVRTTATSFLASHGMCSSCFQTPEPILSVARGRSTAGPSHSRHFRCVAKFGRSRGIGRDRADLFRKACEFGLDGLVSKRREGAYRPRPSANWVKVKNQKHPALAASRISKCPQVRLRRADCVRAIAAQPPA